MKNQILQFGEFLQEFRDVDRAKDQPRFCFVMGSGCAVTCGIPTGAQLVDRWLGELHDQECAYEKRLRTIHEWDNEPLPPLPEPKLQQLRSWAKSWKRQPPGFTWETRAEAYGHIFERRFRRPEIGRAWLRKLILGRPVSVGYHLLGRILITSEHRVVITTNFDRLVEDAIAISEGISVLPFGSKDLAKYLLNAQTTPVVAKIHGDVQLDTYNASRDIRELDREWQKAITTLLSNHTPIVIGYGGNDPGFMHFLSTNAAKLMKGRPIYWCSRSVERDASHPRIKEVAQYPDFRFVRIPGFEELMIALSDCFSLQPFEELIQRRKEKIIADYRAAHERSRQAMQGSFEIAHNPLVVSDSIGSTQISAETQKLDTSSEQQATIPSPQQRTWQDWIRAIDAIDSPDHKNLIIAQALEELPKNFALQAVASNFRHARNPADEDQLKLVENAAKEAERTLGWENPEALTAYFFFAQSLHNAGRFAGAEEMYRRLYEFRKERAGPEQVSTMAAQNGLAIALQQQGKFKEAEQLLRQLVKIAKKKKGIRDERTLSAMNNLGICYALSGKMNEAIPLHKKVYEARRKLLGEDHSKTLGSLTNLANEYASTGKVEIAIRLHRKAANIAMRVFGAAYPRTLSIQNNLANALDKAGRRKDAEKLLRRVYAMRHRILGDSHPLTVASEQRLKEIQMRPDNRTGAEPPT